MASSLEFSLYARGIGKHITMENGSDVKLSMLFVFGNSDADLNSFSIDELKLRTQTKLRNINVNLIFG